jgi:hypothetical protein
VVELLESIIEYGVKNREFRQINPNAVALTIYEIIEDTALFWSLAIMDFDFEKQLREGINLIPNAIKVNK